MVRFGFRSSSMLVCALAVIAAVALRCAGNPIGPEVPPDSTFYMTGTGWDVFMIFLLNITVNTSLYAGIFLLLASRDELFPEKVRKSRRLVVLVVMAATIITAVGAVLDYVLVSLPVEQVISGSAKDARMLVPQLANWSIAVALIFTSILITSIVILRLPITSSVSLALIMAAVSPVWWLLIWWFGSGAAILTLIAGILMTPYLLKGVADWNLARSGKGAIINSIPGPLAQVDGGQSYRGAPLSRVYDPPPNRSRGKT